MNRREYLTHLSAWLTPGLVASLGGCAQERARLQSDEEPERDRYEAKTVGDVTTVGRTEPVRIGGVGLVTGLVGTGGESPPDTYRTMLEDDLRKQGIKNPKELLASTDNALVLVSASVSPGVGKNDPIDVEVVLPPRSKATSLRGGVLHRCKLFSYGFTKDVVQGVNPDYRGANVAMRHHAVAIAEGRVLVGFGDGDESMRVKSGRIWAGGRCTDELPYTLLLNQDQQYARVAGQIAERVNGAFHGSTRSLPGQELANAKNNLAVYLRVPPQYKLNQPRYLRVVRLVPIRENPDGGDGKRRPYRQRLADDLLDPARTVTTALRLEALGYESVPILKTGLDSKHPLVRFCSAEALAYLGSPSCGEELARCVKERPRLRAFALTAMASLDEAICQVKLAELLTHSEDDETRYGAFRALRTLNDRNPTIAGEHVSQAFWLHRVAPESAPLVHLTTSRRAEIVLFGEEPRLLPPFSFLAGTFAITAAPEDERCTLSSFPAGGGVPERRQCSLRLEDILRTMAEMGGLYPEAVELLQQAHTCQALSCRVRSDALPLATSVYELVKAGRSANGFDDDELVPNGQDLGATPTLYEPAYGKRDGLSLLRDRKPNERKTAER